MNLRLSAIIRGWSASQGNDLASVAHQGWWSAYNQRLSMLGRVLGRTERATIATTSNYMFAQVRKTWGMIYFLTSVERLAILHGLPGRGRMLLGGYYGDSHIN